jgi:hypothetical protein
MLAPDIQEEILFTIVAGGRDTITERALRPVTLLGSWQEQRVAWARARRSCSGSS